MSRLTATFPNVRKEDIARFYSTPKVELTTRWHTDVVAVDPESGENTLSLILSANDAATSNISGFGDYLSSKMGAQPTIFDESGTKVYPLPTQAL